MRKVGDVSLGYDRERCALSAPPDPGFLDLAVVTGNATITAVKSEALAQHVLARAAAKVGGVAKLASRLNLSPRVLHYYVTGRLVVPDALFLRALDVVLEEPPNTGLATQQDAQSLPESKRDH
jgi:hypothetical protein